MERTLGTAVLLRPVVEAEGRVRRGLDLGDGHAGAEGVHGPGREVVEVPPLDGDPLQEPGQAGPSRCRPHVIQRDSRAESFEDGGAGFGVDHVPGLGLGEPSRAPGRVLLVGVDLDREVFGGVEQLDQEWEVTGRGG